MPTSTANPHEADPRRATPKTKRGIAGVQWIDGRGRESLAALHADGKRIVLEDLKWTIQYVDTNGKTAGDREHARRAGGEGDRGVDRGPSRTRAPGDSRTRSASTEPRTTPDRRAR